MAKKKRRQRSLADPSVLPPLDGKKIQVIIETPKGSRNKYSFDPELRVFSLKESVACRHELSLRLWFRAVYESRRRRCDRRARAHG